MADMKKLSFQIPIAIVCLVLAFALTWQIKGEMRTRALYTPEATRMATLLDDLRIARERNDDLTMQLLQQRDDIEGFRAEVAQNSDAAALLASQLERAEMLAGMSDLEGEGVIVTLTDNWGLIHDDMILRVINELNASGAEAVSVNGERIISTSGIRCAGPTVIINGTPYAAPFVIHAIGPASTMNSGLRLPGGVEAFIVNFGGNIDIRMSSNVEISRFTGAFVPQYARTPGGEEDEE